MRYELRFSSLSYEFSNYAKFEGGFGGFGAKMYTLRVGGTSLGGTSKNFLLVTTSYKCRFKRSFDEEFVRF